MVKCMFNLTLSVEAARVAIFILERRERRPAPIYRLVTASRDSTVRVWHVRTGECVHVLEGHVGTVRCVDFDGYKSILA
jgi:WD40 repeat protein